MNTKRDCRDIRFTSKNETSQCRSRWRTGDIQGSIVRLEGDVETSGDELIAAPELLRLFEDFLRWQPIPSRNAKQLAELSARLCRLLRDEVSEQLGPGSPALTALATDWRTRCSAPWTTTLIPVYP